MVSGIAKFIIQLLDESNEFEKLVEDVKMVMNLSESAKVSSRRTSFVYNLLVLKSIASNSHGLFLESLIRINSFPSHQIATKISFFVISIPVVD